MAICVNFNINFSMIVYLNLLEFYHLIVRFLGISFQYLIAFN